MEKKIIIIEEFGEVEFIKSTKNKNIIFRIDKDCRLKISFPYYSSYTDAKKILLDNKTKLLNQIQQAQNKIFKFHPENELKFLNFDLKYSSGDKNRIVYKNNVTTIYYNDINIFKNENIQINIKKNLQKIMRSKAKDLFTSKVEYFSQKYKLTYKSIKVNFSRTNWGSCSNVNNLNFSAYSLFFPEEQYIDYLVLHELTHTIHKNHSKDFWTQLNLYCGYNTKDISKTLRYFKIPI